MRKKIFPFFLAVASFGGAALEIPDRPGKVTKGISIFPEQQVQYSTFQNFLHYWNDRPLFIDRSHRYPGNKYVFNTEASLNTDFQIARRYGIAGLCPLSTSHQRIKVVLETADKHYSDDFRIMPAVYPALGKVSQKAGDKEKQNFFKIIEYSMKSKSAWRIGGKVVINSYEATRLTPEALKQMIDEAHGKFGDTFLFSACMKIPGQRLYNRFTANGRTLKPEDIKWYTDTVQSYLDICGGLYLYGVGHRHDYDGEYGSRIDSEYFYKFYRPIAWKIMTDPRNKGKIFGILCNLGYVNNFTGQVNPYERGSETLLECFKECLSINPDYIVPFEWNEWNENTCFIPSIYKGSGVERLMIYLNSIITKNKLVPRKGDDVTLPNAILSYRFQLKLGEILRFEFLMLPDGSPEFEGDAVLILRDPVSGKIVKTHKFHYRNGDYKARTLEIPTEELAASQVLVPELRLTDSNGKEKLIGNMLYIRLLPSYNNIYQYVRHVIRDDAPVKAEWSVKPDGDAFIVSGKVSSKEELRHVELLDNRDEMRAVEDEPEFDHDKTLILRMGVSARNSAYLTGTMRVLNVGKAKARSTFSDGSREFFSYDTLEDGLKFKRALIGRGYREALFTIDADKADKAIFAADLKQGKFSFPIKKILENGGCYAVELPGRNFFQFEVAQNQLDLPLKLTGKETRFRFRVKSKFKFPVFSLRVLTQKGKVWHSQPLLPKKVSAATEEINVYSETQRKAITINLAKDRVIDLDYKFDPANGAMMLAAGRPDFIATLGGAYHYGTAMNSLQSKLPGSKTSVPVWRQDTDKTWFLRFDGIGSYVALPMEALPRGAFTLEMEIRPASDQEMVLFRTQGVYPINSFSLLSRWNKLLGSWYDGPSRVRPFPTQLALKVNEWNKVAVRYDLKTITFSCNGKSQSFPFNRRQLLYSASCFGGQTASYGIPPGKPFFFKGDLRKLHIIQR